MWFFLIDIYWLGVKGSPHTPKGSHYTPSAARRGWPTHEGLWSINKKSYGNIKAQLLSTKLFYVIF